MLKMVRFIMPKKIIKKTSFDKVFAFGCSGDEKHHLIRPIFVDNRGCKLLTPVDNFENFAPENIEKLLSRASSWRSAPRNFGARRYYQEIS